jgi:hypothetical protein
VENEQAKAPATCIGGAFEFVVGNEPDSWLRLFEARPYTGIAAKARLSSVTPS